MGCNQLGWAVFSNRAWLAGPFVTGLGLTSCADVLGADFEDALLRERTAENRADYDSGFRTPAQADKVDLVLAIDNSRSMADKQEILALAVPDLVRNLATPPCISVESGETIATPSDPLAECPDGARREFTPIRDIHIGVITSSLGGHGSDACWSDGAGKVSNNDMGHLVARVDPAGTAVVETYQNHMFLAWDPSQNLKPPGEGDLNVDGADANNTTALLPQLRSLVIGAGQIGCGYEAQLESWYRFLVEPFPPAQLLIKDNHVVFEGTDDELLAQRKNFLRPDSLLVIVLLSDENDCSIREYGDYYRAAQQKGSNNGPFHLPSARTICDADPNNECCFSCGQAGPTDENGVPTCPDDPACAAPDGKNAYHSDLTDNINLRCWDQKRRFGIDFLYPISRYANALKSPAVTDHRGEVADNPIFDHPNEVDDPNDVNKAPPARDSSLVLVLGIVGVPWQDIARTNGDGMPDLLNGLDFEKRARGGLKDVNEMALPLHDKDFTTWDVILGDPAKYPSLESLPRDPLMIEHHAPRAGTNPITGDPLVTSETPLGNPINGHERSIPDRDDLQYACTFPLVQVDPATGAISDLVRDCSVAGLASCDCEEGTTDSPLCQINDTTGHPTNQVAAKAYPGIRHLQFLRSVGWQGVVGSVCPAQLKNRDADDFGYRPAIRALMERMAPHLPAPE